MKLLIKEYGPYGSECRSDSWYNDDYENPYCEEGTVSVGVFATYYLDNNDYDIIDYDYITYDYEYYPYEECDKYEVKETRYSHDMPESYENLVRKKLASGKYKGVWVFYGFNEDGTDCMEVQLTPSNCKEVAEDAYDVPDQDGDPTGYVESIYEFLYKSLCVAGDSKYANYTPEDFDERKLGDALAYFMRYTSDEEFASKGVILYR